LHATTFMPASSTSYTLSVIISSNAAVMAVKGAQLVYAANN
jgi:hypothetical protein